MPKLFRYNAVCDRLKRLRTYSSQALLAISRRYLRRRIIRGSARRRYCRSNSHRAAATGNVHKNAVKLGRIVSMADMFADRQRDTKQRHTDRQTCWPPILPIQLLDVLRHPPLRLRHRRVDDGRDQTGNGSGILPPVMT